MRMKSTGIWPLELIGKITDVKVLDDWLIMHLRTSTPAGWDLKAALTHEDLRTLFKLLLKPSNLKYLVLGFFRPLGNKPPPEY
jgi:hypothetical protein